MTLKKWLSGLIAAGTLASGAAAFAHESDGRFGHDGRFIATPPPVVVAPPAQVPCTDDAHSSFSPVAHARVHGVTHWSNAPSYRYDDWNDWRRRAEFRRLQRTRQVRYGRWVPPSRYYYQTAPAIPQRPGVYFQYGR